MSEDNQGSLFDLGESRTARDAGMAGVASRSNEYIIKALALIAHLPHGSLVIGEDITRACEEAGIVPPDPHAHGSMIRTAEERGLLRRTGKYGQMTKVSSHARESREYRIHSPFRTVATPEQPTQTVTARYEDGHLITRCATCGGDAPYGFNVSLLRDQLGTWYCKSCKPNPTSNSR